MPVEGYITADASSFASTIGLTKDQLLQHAYRPIWVWLRGTLITAYWLAWVAMLVTAVIIINNTPKCKSPPPLEWWQQSPMYQIQVESFSDGGHPMNGLGDIAGLESRLDYIESLGIRTVCLSSIFDSPVSDPCSVIDFKTIAPHFGTVEDFTSLVKKMKGKDMKLILDFIPNHTSDKHQWFQRSIKRENPYTDYYVWSGHVGKDTNGKPVPPNGWINTHGESAWQWNQERKEFYLHQFSSNQPDLNYHSSELLFEMKDILSFWLNLGVNGFRLRDVRHLLEDNSTVDSPQALGILQEFREVMDNTSIEETKVLLVEDDIPLCALRQYYGNTTKPLAHLAISTKFSANIHQNVSAGEMFENIRKIMENVPGEAWPNWMVGDKDILRLTSRVGSSLAEAINMITLLLPGTPLTYYGDEIGMENVEERTWTNSGEAKNKIVPYSLMQWNTGRHAGFSDAEHTWLPVNNNYQTVNVESEENADWSPMKIYRTLVAIRNSEAVLNGDIELKLFGNQVFAYTRIKKGVPGILVAANFDDRTVMVDFTKMKNVPAMSSVVAFSTSYNNNKYKIRSKISNGAVSFPGKGGVVLTFVPSFRIYETESYE